MVVLNLFFKGRIIKGQSKTVPNGHVNSPFHFLLFQPSVANKGRSGFLYAVVFLPTPTVCSQKYRMKLCHFKLQSQMQQTVALMRQLLPVWVSGVCF